ncbi:hypothetical protein E2C01_020339 [Portunus trituberculatus]|uniref:Uncharacterized protein n=1 Tax=Portunus trituberculatus TaxID=210409 RepID=A0A5B7E1Q9_PORTR|nr:hypothetical protein [Portunus trituberculatus]
MTQCYTSHAIDEPCHVTQTPHNTSTRPRLTITATLLPSHHNSNTSNTQQHKAIHRRSAGVGRDVFWSRGGGVCVLNVYVVLRGCVPDPHTPRPLPLMYVYASAQNASSLSPCPSLPSFSAKPEVPALYIVHSGSLIATTGSAESGLAPPEEKRSAACEDRNAAYLFVVPEFPRFERGARVRLVEVRYFVRHTEGPGSRGLCCVPWAACWAKADWPVLSAESPSRPSPPPARHLYATYKCPRNAAAAAATTTAVVWVAESEQNEQRRLSIPRRPPSLRLSGGLAGRGGAGGGGGQLGSGSKHS